VTQALDGGHEAQVPGQDGRMTLQRFTVAEHHRGVFGEHFKQPVRVLAIDITENVLCGGHCGLLWA
jgi:hypothetical protein